MVGLTDVLAHQGGWDEILLVAAPIVVFVVLLRVANSRAQRIEAPDGVGPEPGGLRPPDSDGGTKSAPDR
ncbi:MAG: hypothetical protein H0U29_13325 [Acidimicrobiia bacterium]|nr:hypothetical protein [Acidimicrobiia bacterium]